MDSNRTDKAPHSKPISINTAAAQHRYRSGSLSSDSSDGSSDPVQTPLNANSPKVSTVSPSTSPLFTYIMGQQPGTAKTFPFRRGTVDSIGSTGTVFDDDDTQESDSAPLRKVHRRATTSWTTPLPQPANPLAGERQERASGLLRRLSLSTSFSRPQPGFGNNDQVPAVPPNTALPNSPTNRNSPSNGRNSPPRKPVRRAPSPMGERILKGHFDGFN